MDRGGHRERLFIIVEYSVTLRLTSVVRNMLVFRRVYGIAIKQGGITGLITRP